MRRPAGASETLDEAWVRIDKIDGALLALRAERAALVDRVTVLKAEPGVAAAAPTRGDAVIASVRERAQLAGFDANIAEAMWRVMIAAFTAREERVLGTDGVDG